jgi:hypothetical protein
VTGPLPPIPPGLPSAPVTDTAVTQLAQADARKGWRPPRVIFHTFVLLTALTLIWSASLPVWSFDSFMLGATATFILGVVWVIRLIEALIRRHPSKWFLAAPALAALAALIIASGAPQTIRWNMSQSALEQTAKTLPRDTDYGSYNRRIGLYLIESWERSPDGAISLTTADEVDLFTGLVLVYYPPSTPVPQPNVDIHRLDERWSWTTVDNF